LDSAVKRNPHELHFLSVRENETYGEPFSPIHELHCLMFALATLISLSVVFSLQARSPKRHSGQNAGTFDYYMLVLSYAPDFCAEPGGNKDPRECGKGRKVGFVVHGLWPQDETGRGPENCGPARPVAQDIVSATLSYVPSASLIQHEWSAHGTCSGFDSAAYFALLRKARDSVKIPDELNQPGQQARFSQADIQAKLASANQSFSQGSFRISCYRDENLQEVRVCLNKDLSPRACTASAGQCPVNAVTLQPVR
jgi:ribonuclease T2